MTAVWDAEVPDRSRPAPGPDGESRRRRVALAVLVVLVAVVGGLLLFRGGDRPQVDGEQPASPSNRVRGPGTRIFFEIEATDGTVRDGWPPPMIARDSELVCFGFGRLDFRPPIRPTVARCVETDEIPDLGTDDIVSLMSVQAGTDSWHVLMTGATIDSVELRQGASDVDAGRIHVDDDIVALRLHRGTDVTELSWITGRTRVTCSPPVDAVESGRFCPLPGTS